MSSSFRFMQLKSYASIISIELILSPARTASITSKPSTTLPKQVWLRSKCAVLVREWQIKNCEPPVFLPA